MMAAENPDTTAVKVESSTENGNTTSETNTQHGNEQSHTQHPGNRRGGGRFGFGNRRPNFNVRIKLNYIKIHNHKSNVLL